MAVQTNGAHYGRKVSTVLSYLQVYLKIVGKVEEMWENPQPKTIMPVV